MEFDWLEAFIELAKCSSIRAAAARLGISPAAMSAKIKDLENYLNTTLFIKDSNGCKLTIQGQTYIPYAERILSSWNNISASVKNISHSVSNKLNLAFQGFSKPGYISRFLERFINEHNNILLGLYDDRDFGLIEGLSSGKIDAYFLHNPPDLNPAKFTTQHIGSFPMDILVSGNHRLSSRNTVKLQELEGEVFVLYPETKEPSFRNHQIELLKNSDIRYTLFNGYASPTYTLSLVQLGYGIAFLPHNTVNQIPPKTTLIELDNPRSNSDFCMVYKNDNKNPALTEFLDCYNINPENL